jgi:cbb3-type cytochrome oxidase maturation protein
MPCACKDGKARPIASKRKRESFLMEILYLLIPLSVALVFLIAGAFWWSLKNGQFEDLEGPAYRILMDDDRPEQGDKIKDPSLLP